MIMLSFDRQWKCFERVLCRVFAFHLISPILLFVHQAAFELGIILVDAFAISELLARCSRWHR